MTNLDYLYNPEPAKKSPVFNRKYFVDKKLSFRTIEHGMILPPSPTGDDGKKKFLGYGGIVDKNGDYIKESFIHYETGGKYTPPAESVQRSNKTVIYLGTSWPVWGHVITDNLRRLWFLNSEYFKSFKNCPLVYIVTWSDIKQQKNFCRLLEILGVDIEKLRPITQPTQFEKIILPDESFNILSPLSGFTAEYKESIDRVRDFALKNCTPTSSKKIYYFHDVKAQVGAERLAKYFKAKGYEIVRPERLTLDEQLNLLINCKSFASTLGSCSHNSLFLCDKTESIFIPRNPDRFTVYQPVIDELRSLNATYVDTSLSICGNYTLGPFYYMLSEQLKRFFGDKFDGYEEEDFKTFLQYVKYSLDKNYVLNQSFVAGYGSILSDFIEQLRRRKDLLKDFGMDSFDWDKFRPKLSYQTHVAVRGWNDGWKNENQLSNPLTRKNDIQAIKINLPGYKVYYSVYYNGQEGWSEEVLSPKMAGTTGESKSVYGIKIWLDETGAKKFDILYRVYKYDGKWTSWAKNGEIIYSHGIKLNAIQIKLETKAGI